MDVPENTKILIAPLPRPAREYPLSLEKLSPVLAYFVSENEAQGFEYAKAMLELGGLGHSAVIHSNDEALCLEYSKQMKVGRVIANSPSSQGAIGDIYNTNTPSLTLGCGSFGRNSTTANVSSVNLINKKRLAKRRVNMQWFKIPPKIYFERGSVQYLEAMPDVKRAFIVTDPVMAKLGYVDKVTYYLNKREDSVHYEVFSEVEPDPSVETIMRGVRAMNAFQPDVIIALGGGSAIDAAKGMWLFYEHPDTSFDGLKLKFIDIRKRAFHFPNLGKKARLVAIPTTSGTGSEVTSFSVITDKANGNIKYPLADYELTPDVAIIDPQFAATMPKSIVADTGLDVLTHAIEAYVSVMASDYTNGLAIKAIELVFKYLPRSWEDPKDELAREKMHNASCIAGMAFSNAFLGVNHSLAHKLGGEFHIPHGRANAVLLPHVIAYNAEKPTKFAIFPARTPSPTTPSPSPSTPGLRSRSRTAATTAAPTVASASPAAPRSPCPPSASSSACWNWSARARPRWCSPASTSPSTATAPCAFPASSPIWRRTPGASASASPAGSRSTSTQPSSKPSPIRACSRTSTSRCSPARAPSCGAWPAPTRPSECWRPSPRSGAPRPIPLSPPT